MTEPRFVVVVPTCDRPKQLSLLLSDLEKEGEGLPLEVRVYDDASSADYAVPAQTLTQRGWPMVRAKVRHGKRRYWEWVSRMMRDLRGATNAYIIFLADDMRLCSGFFGKARKLWEAIVDPQKVAMNLFVDEGRRASPCWTGVMPERRGGVDLTGWIDGAFLCTGRLPRLLGYKGIRVDETWWKTDPKRSSGAWAKISLRLHKAGFSLYRVGRSLLCHADSPSAMHPKVRGSVPLRTFGFADGDARARRLAVPEMVTASLASIPARVDTLAEVVASLRPQVDRLNVYLNGYAKVPAFLLHAGIAVARSQDHGDAGDAGKFHWADAVDGYHLTCDDDLVYPPDYALSMVEGIERYGRRAAVSLHGARLNGLAANYISNRTLYPCLKALSQDLRVHIGGTGVLCYHSSTIRVSRADCRLPNMADIWFAIAAKRRGVPIYVLRHEADTLRHVRYPDTIYDRMAAERAKTVTQVLRDHSPWPAL